MRREEREGEGKETETVCAADPSRGLCNTGRILVPTVIHGLETMSP